MADFLKDAPGLIQGVAVVLTSVLVIWGAWVGVYRPLKTHFDRVNRGMDTLLGYPPVMDPGSGREIQPATPPLAQRVYVLEETHADLVEALKTLADNQRLLMALRDEMDERRRVGDQIVQDFTEWRGQVEKRMKTWADEQSELSALIREQIAAPEQPQEKGLF